MIRDDTSLTGGNINYAGPCYTQEHYANLQFAATDFGIFTITSSDWNELLNTSDEFGIHKEISLRRLLFRVSVLIYKINKRCAKLKGIRNACLQFTVIKTLRKAVIMRFYWGSLKSFIMITSIMSFRKMNASWQSLQRFL